MRMYVLCEDQVYVDVLQNKEALDSAVLVGTWSDVPPVDGFA